jgi:hypothetical protein
MQSARSDELLATSDAVGHLLGECRMVLPGLQALFGFQMIAVFNSSFAEKLTVSQQKLHIASIVLVVISVALVMTPAALHRQIVPRRAGEHFVRVASWLLLAAMPPLAIGICTDVFLVMTPVWHDDLVAGGGVAAALLLLFGGLWFVYPPMYKGMGMRHEAE